MSLLVYHYAKVIENLNRLIHKIIANGCEFFYMRINLCCKTSHKKNVKIGYENNLSVVCILFLKKAVPHYVMSNEIYIKKMSKKELLKTGIIMSACDLFVTDFNGICETLFEELNKQQVPLMNILIL